MGGCGPGLLVLDYLHITGDERAAAAEQRRAREHRDIAESGFGGDSPSGMPGFGGAGATLVGRDEVGGARDARDMIHFGVKVCFLL